MPMHLNTTGGETGVTKREAQILTILRKNPTISHKELAERLGITRSAASVHLTNLAKKGKIIGRGYILEQPNYAVVIGGANMDVNGFSSGPLIPQNFNAGKIRLEPGGEARNLAENLARLGVGVKLISAIGGDVFGEKILADCRSLGIDVTGCLILPGENSSLFIGIVSPDGEMALGLSDMTIEQCITPAFLEGRWGALAGAKVMSVGSGLPVESIEYLLTAFAGKEIVVDAGSVAKLSSIRHLIGAIPTLQLNSAEAEHLSGIAISTEEDALRAAKQIGRMGPKRVVVTMGPRGAALSTASSEGIYRARPIKPVSDAGVGTAFTSGLCYGLAYDYSEEDTIFHALACAALNLEGESAVNHNLSLKSVQDLAQQLSREQ
ncbi:pseudouridine kinase [Bittarella massiliensis (ex Durand et al. 2017)]|uniref:Pseudouridine kinase n=2 Tax=Clostridia TaxID=186801 RepID=A0AAQ1MC96_9FIRM|nr:HTH domain protein [Clostridium sp. ATCC 29733]SHF84278.1 pseudouridine kinase [Bittarella massiliensis (ex Durand et al. 2017)]